MLPGEVTETPRTADVVASLAFGQLGMPPRGTGPWTFVPSITWRRASELV
jgi:hypothetical protein